MSTYLRVPLATSRSSVRRARDVVRVWLADVGRSSVEYVAAQIVDELTTNAVVHAHGPIVLHLWCRRDGVRIGVSDGSTTVPELMPDDPSAPNGRGLHLVARLASEWGTDVHERGKIIWADVAVGGAGCRRRELPAARVHAAAQWHLGWQGAGAATPTEPRP